MRHSRIHIFLRATLIFSITGSVCAMEKNDPDTLARKKSLKLLRHDKQKKHLRTLYDENLPKILKTIIHEAKTDQRIKRELEGPDWSIQHRTMKSFDIVDGQACVATQPAHTNPEMENNPSLLTQGLVWCASTLLGLLPDTRATEHKHNEQNYNKTMCLYASKLIECFGSIADQRAGKFHNTMLRDITDEDLERNDIAVTTRLERLMRLNIRLYMLYEPAIERALSSLDAFISRNEEIWRNHKRALHLFQQERLLALAQERATQEEQTKTYHEPLTDDDLLQIALLDKKRTQQAEQQP